MRRMNSYVKPCKFFLQGTCRNGSNCRFSHDTNGNEYKNKNSNTSGSFAVQSSCSTNGNTSSTTMTESGRTLAIEELQHPPIWPLSGFAIAKGLPSIVMNDVSCEEARWEAYQEQKVAGNCIQSMQKYQALVAEQQAQRQRVVSLLKNSQSAQKLFNGEILSESKAFGANISFGGGITASLFGGPSSLFNGKTTTTRNPFSGNNAAATPSSSPFGTPSTSTASSFGGAAASPFGGGSSSTTAFGTSLGAAGSAGLRGSASASLFGSAAASPSPFGNAAAPSASPFGAASVPSSSQFGNGIVATGSPFGNAASTPTAAFSGSNTGSSFTGFGGNGAKPVASPFSNGVATPASSPFGGSASSTFGMPSVTTPFGGISSSDLGSSLGSNIGVSSPFQAFSSSSSATPSPFAAPSNSAFGTPTASTSATSAAGESGNAKSSPSSVSSGSLASTTAAPPPSAASTSSCVPSDVRDDTWNAEQFRQAKFSLGMVPTVPPPPHFC